MAIGTFSGPRFAERFALRSTQYCWLIGSGASASAGIPTGYTMIVDFKKRLFCQMSGTPFREVDANDPIWAARIDQFFAARSVLPAPGDPSEYARAFEAVYPTQADRREYIGQAVQRGTPSFGHRVLAALLTMKRIPCIFTTNFDQLVDNATTVADSLLPAPERANMTVAAIDSAARASRCIAESAWPLLAKLHGDFQSTELKNTDEELKEQDASMRAVLKATCGRFGLIVLGYSGRDESVMRVLMEACEQPGAFPAGIYWITSNPSSVMRAVTAFLEHARAAGIDATFVQSENFDEFAADIAERVNFPSVLKNHVYEARPAPMLVEVPTPAHEEHKFPVLQCSAVPVLALPETARLITVAKPITTRALRDLLTDKKVRATVASTGHEIAAFGKDVDLRLALTEYGPALSGEIRLYPDRDSWALGLLYDALVRAICNGQALVPILRARGHFVLVGRGKADETPDIAAWRRASLDKLRAAYFPSYLSGTIPKIDLPFTEGVRLRLEQTAGRWWCVFEPITYVDRPRRDVEEDDAETGNEQDFIRALNPEVDWNRERWAMRYNKAWAKIIAAWAQTIARNGMISAYGLELGHGADAVFRLSTITGWSRPGNDHPYLHRR